MNEVSTLNFEKEVIVVYSFWLGKSNSHSFGEISQHSITIVMIHFWRNTVNTENVTIQLVTHLVLLY